MFDKDNSKLLSLEEYADYYNKKHEEEIEFFKNELMKLEKEDSREEGRSEGLIQGRNEKERDMIINLNKQNVSLDIIAKACNLSLDKIKSIINNKM